MKLTHTDNFCIGWLYGKRKPWQKGAMYIRRNRMEAWTPSPAQRRHLFPIGMMDSPSGHSPFVHRRKPWAMKHAGFRLRTNPKEYA